MDGGLGRQTPGHSRAPEPAQPSTVLTPTHSCTQRDGGPGRYPGAFMLPRIWPDHTQSQHTTRHTLGGEPAGYPRAFMLPRSRPSHARPQLHVHGTAGRRASHDRPGHGTSQWHQHTHPGRQGRDKPAEIAGRTLAREARHSTPALPGIRLRDQPRSPKQPGRARKRASAASSRSTCKGGWER